jgi:hypothetical protein
MMRALSAVVMIALTLSACSTQYWWVRGYNRSNPSMTVRIVDGKVLHPDTGLPVDCDVFRANTPIQTSEYKGGGYPGAAFNREVGGYPGLMSGLTGSQVMQGIEIFKACERVRAAQ